MCGFTGFIDSTASTSGEALESLVRRMAETLHHRGPDDRGAWVDAQSGVALGHTRLSIIDLSVEGHQPQESHSGRYVIAYNGEVYNFRSLQNELEKDSGAENISWHGHSDTEVVLAAIEHWGLEQALSRFIGMFAFALWDRRERCLHLVRDRIGIKPLYFGVQGKSLMFGSELSALRRHPDFEGKINRNALGLLLRHNYIRSPQSIYEGIQKLTPGHILTLKHPFDQVPDSKPFWSAYEMVQRGFENPWKGTEEEAVEELDQLLRDAVGQRLVADVPLGAFLSGGIDSSVVVALMQQIVDRPVKTFSIGFNESGFDEAVYAKEVARHLGTDHTELYLTGDKALDVVPRLPQMFDEPFADSSQIPMYLVSEMARRDVKVALSGDGGDELFGGYAQYLWGQSIKKWMDRIPRPIRCLGSKGVQILPVSAWNKLLEPFKPLIGKKIKMNRLGEKMYKLAHVMEKDDLMYMYRAMLSHWESPATVVLGIEDPPFLQDSSFNEKSFPDSIQFMMFLDSVNYLPGDILTKVDRASMAVALEARVPLLDHRVYELAWRMPQDLKIRNGSTKWLLRQVLYRYVPKELIERPKMGFSIPLAAWLRGPLKEWGEDLLDPTRLRQEGYFDSHPITQKWNEHQSQERDWAALLWDVLMFQAWLRNTQN